MRYHFWRFVHNKLEQAWHWVYYHRLAALEKERNPVIYTPPVFFLVEETDDYKIYRSAG